MTLATRLLVAGGGASFVVPDVLPTSWGVTRLAGNPVVTVNPGNPAESFEQYVPAPVRLTSGDVWVYVKGGSRVYAWKSTDDGETFSLQNSGNPVLQPVAATWESNFVLEPATVYDSASGTIHLFYKGRAAGANTWAWGHATAPDSTPTVFTRDGANPILTSATVSTALGGLTVSDLAIGDVIGPIGGLYYFYGYAAYNSRYRIIQATGSTWNNPSAVADVLVASNDNEVVITPSVIRLDHGYAMLYSIGGPQPDDRWVRAGSSRDLVTWDFSDTTNILSPTSGWEVDEAYSGHVVKVTTAPYALPYEDGLGRWLLYYSGLASTVAQSGLAYLEPTF